jgi:signal transduction histidine kinase
MKLRALLDAALGRRVVVRVWLHSLGLLLFVAFFMLVVVRYAVIRLGRGAIGAMAVTIGEQSLALRDRPEFLAEEFRKLGARGQVEVTIYDARDRLVVTSAKPPPPPLTAEERGKLARAGHISDPFERWPGRHVGAVFEGGRLSAYAIVARPRPEIPWQAHAFITTVLVLGVVVVSIPLARSIARPLGRLRALTRELGGGNLAVRAPDDRRRDEIGDLARAFNDMADSMQRLRNAERELLADVSHELRTPLARMRVVVELAAQGDVVRMQSCLAEISTDLSELEQILADIFTSTRFEIDDDSWREAHPPLREEIVEAEAVAAAAVMRFRERWPRRKLTYRVAEPHLLVEGDPIMLRRALENFVENARKYSADDQDIRIEVSRDELHGEPAVKIEVIDEGIGIAPEDQARVFDSFFRADRSRTRATGGVGLGLSLARRIVEAHGGVVGVDSEPDRGSRFWFALPLAAAAT